MSNASVGGLYVAVTLDTRLAARQLAAMGATYTKALAAGTAASAAGATAAAAATAKLNKEGESAVVQVTKMRLAYAGFQKALGKFGNTASAAGGKVTNTLGAALGGTTGKLAGMGAALTATTVGVAALAVAAIGAVVAVGSLVAATYKLGKAGFNTAVDLELLDVSLTAILGSADAAASEMNALIDVAIESPFLTPVVIEMDKFLLSQGLVSAEIRGNLIPAILDMSAAYGLSSDNLRSISYAMAQVQSRGYLSGDELRQLANQLVPVWKILREIPEYAQLSQQELRKLSEAGDISAETFQRAVISYAEQFDGAAQDAANTVAKLSENIKDITTIRLGKAFLDLEDIKGASSPLEVVRNLLLEIKNIVSTVDFGPLAASMGNFMNALTSQLQSFLHRSGGGIVTFFEEWLPNAINYAAQAAYVFTTVLRVAVDFISSVVQSISRVFASMISGVGSSVGGWGNIWKGMAAIAAIAGGTIITIIQLVATATASLVNFISQAFGGATTEVAGFGDAFASGAEFVESSYRTMANAIDAAGKIKIPDLSGLTDQAAEFRDAADDSAAAGSSSDGGGASKAASNIASDMEEAMDTLYDLTYRWQGFRSELEKGLLGDEGFTATMDQIIAMGRKVSDALNVIGDTAAAERVINATMDLYELARQRNEVVSLLAEAEANLSDIVSERDNFTRALRESAIAFGAALDLEEKVTQKWNDQTGEGFFTLTDTTETQTFVDSLKERSIALTEFYANIKALQAGGLDPRLLRQLLEAGPEDGGGVAAQLAAGGASLIGEANVLYDGIAETAEELAALGAEEFYDAGVAEAEGLVEGLQSQLDEIEAAAIAMGDIIYEEALTWADEMFEAGAAAGGGSGGSATGGGFAGGITASIPSAVHAAAVMANDTIHEFDGLGNDMYDQGYIGGDSLTTGMTDGISNMVGEYVNFLKQTDTFVSGLNTKFDGIDDIVLEFAWPKIWDLMVAGFKKLLSNIPPAIENLVTGLRDVVFGQNPFGGYYPGGNSATGSSVNASFQADHVDTQMTGDSASTSTAYGVGGASTTRPLGTPVVKVYIGDTELKDMVRTEVIYEDSQEATRVLMGRRV